MFVTAVCTKNTAAATLRGHHFHLVGETAQTTELLLGQASAYRQEMRNVDDMQYVAEMYLGGQELEGVLDTGSYEMVVFSARCYSSDCIASLDAGMQFYDSGESDTYNASEWYTTLVFGSGSVYSQMGFDSLEFGPVNTSVYFWEVLRSQMPLLAHGPFNAIVGLGPPQSPYEAALQQAQADSTDESQQFAALLKEQEPLLEALHVTIFSVCLQPSPNTPGFVIWNDTDPALSPEVFNKIPVSGDISWSVEMTSIKLAGYDIDFACEDGCGTIIDSGTSLIGAPHPFVDLMLVELNKIENICDHMDEAPRLVFNLGGIKHSLPPSSYLGDAFDERLSALQEFLPNFTFVSKATQKQCQLLIMSTDSITQSGPMMILGLPFFREYYTTFDLGSSPTAPANERNIYTAYTDEHCNNPAGRDMLYVRKQSYSANRRVDASKMRVSKGVWQAMTSKHVRI